MYTLLRELARDAVLVDFRATREGQVCTLLDSWSRVLFCDGAICLDNRSAISRYTSRIVPIDLAGSAVVGVRGSTTSASVCVSVLGLQTSVAVDVCFGARSRRAANLQSQCLFQWWFQMGSKTKTHRDVDLFVALCC